MKRTLFTFASLVWIFAATAGIQAKAADADAGTPLEIVALGDSLTAGYMLAPGAGFPEQLSVALIEAGHNVNVINAGVSGDTSTGGLARLDWALTPETDALILELGSNDALRGIEPELTRSNLETIIQRARERNISVLLVGMLAPPNMGSDYGDEFGAIFTELADKYGLLLYPFFLDGVAAQPELNLPDGMHPTAEGVGIIVEKILPTVEELIKTAGTSAPATH